MQTEHDNLKAEIETREKTLSEVVALGEDMVAEEHSAIGEVKEKIIPLGYFEVHWDY